MGLCRSDPGGSAGGRGADAAALLSQDAAGQKVQVRPELPMPIDLALIFSEVLHKHYITVHSSAAVASMPMPGSHDHHASLVVCTMLVLVGAVTLDNCRVGKLSSSEKPVPVALHSHVHAAQQCGESTLSLLLGVHHVWMQSMCIMPACKACGASSPYVKHEPS